MKVGGNSSQVIDYTSTIWLILAIIYWIYFKLPEVKFFVLFAGGFEGITSASFDLQTSDGTAVDGSDYTGGVFPLIINFVGTGGTTSQFITIADDGVIYSIFIEIYNNVNIIDLQLGRLSNIPLQMEECGNLPDL